MMDFYFFAHSIPHEFFYFAEFNWKYIIFGIFSFFCLAIDRIW